jgi:hypothetical protein
MRLVEEKTIMKTMFLVESDTDYASIFAEQLERVWVDHEFHYRKIENGIRFCDIDRSQFFGNLSSLLRTRTTPAAPPMELAEPNLPKNRVDQAIAEAEQAVDRVTEVAK